MNIATLRSLQQRVREATGADRKLDRDIAAALEWPFAGWLSFEEHRAKHGYETAWVAHNIWINDGHTKGAQLPNWTTDPGGLGACVALLGAVLPGAEFELSTIYGLAHVNLPLNLADHETMQFVRREDGNKCLAFCEAIIAAVIAKEEAMERV